MAEELKKIHSRLLGGERKCHFNETEAQLMPEYKDRHFLSSTRKLHPQLWVPGPGGRLGQGNHKENVIAPELKPYVFVFAEPCQD